MRTQKYIYLLTALLLFVFTADLQGQFRRKKVKLSQTNKIEEFINDYIQDPFMVEHIQSIQSELVKLGFEILPPETDGDMEIEINFDDFMFDPYYGSTADPKSSYIIFRTTNYRYGINSYTLHLYPFFTGSGLLSSFLFLCSWLSW